MTVQDRINQLAQSGLGLSAQDIAAIIGLDPVDVVAYLTNPSDVPSLPSGGSDVDTPVKSFQLFWGSKALAGGGLVFASEDVLKDEIGVTIADAGATLLLPKGYYDSTLLVNPLGVPAMGSPTDQWVAAIELFAFGYSETAPIPNLFGAPCDFDFISGTLDVLNNQALTISHLFESGDWDVHDAPYNSPHHAFASYVVGIGVADVTAGTQLFQGTPGFTDTFDTQVFLQITRLGDKA